MEGLMFEEIFPQPYRAPAADLYLQLTLLSGRRHFPRVDPSILEPTPKPPKTKLRFRSIDEPGEYGERK